MQWTAGQVRALDLAGRWLRSGRNQSFVLGGYAGTGKTTLARHLASGHSGRVHFASYTGKAAHVLRRTGVDATTIHKLIYLPRDKCDERLRRLRAERDVLLSKFPKPEVELSRLAAEIRRERENLRRPDFTLNVTGSLLGEDSLVVVDEYSMVDEQVGRDLLSFGCRVLALGDPGQLPPVQGRRYFREPDYVLTEVVRQAAESPVVALATRVRAGEELVPGTYGESRVVPRKEVPDDEFDRLLARGADQVLVGLNTTRRRVNQRVRRVLGMSGDDPLPGDKLVCLRNSHDEGLWNGQTWRVRRVSRRDFFRLALEGDDGESVTCLAHPECFRGEGDRLDLSRRRRANEFDYGYALTVHKSQGSEWDHVLVLDEWPGQDRRRWLYTALTRASERVTVIC